MSLLSLIVALKRQGWKVIQLEATRRQLLALDERILADLGVTTELLNQGVGAYPWKVMDESVVDSVVTSRLTTPSSARAKLQLPLQMGSYYA